MKQEERDKYLEYLESYIANKQKEVDKLFVEIETATDLKIQYIRLNEEPKGTLIPIRFK